MALRLSIHYSRIKRHSSRIISLYSRRPSPVKCLLLFTSLHFEVILIAVQRERPYFRLQPAMNRHFPELRPAPRVQVLDGQHIVQVIPRSRHHFLLQILQNRLLNLAPLLMLFVFLLEYLMNLLFLKMILFAMYFRQVDGV